MSDIEARVKKIIAEQLGVPESDVSNEKAFVADLGADSLDTVELVMALEDEFGIEIPDEGGRRSPPSSWPSITQSAVGTRRAEHAGSSMTRRRHRRHRPGLICPVGNTVAEGWANLIAGARASALS